MVMFEWNKQIKENYAKNTKTNNRTKRTIREFNKYMDYEYIWILFFNENESEYSQK